MIENIIKNESEDMLEILRKALPKEKTKSGLRAVDANILVEITKYLKDRGNTKNFSEIFKTQYTYADVTNALTAAGYVQDWHRADASPTERKIDLKIVNENPTERIHLTLSKEVKDEYEKWLNDMHFPKSCISMVNDEVFKMFMERKNDIEFNIKINK